ncbi:MAG: APC family permease [Solirubrobacteraceae bacterium]
MATEAVPPTPGADPPLKRAISRNMLLLFVIGDVVGGGIYTLVGVVGGEVGGLVWLPFGLALGLALLTATAYAELVTKYPQAAGAALYVNKAFRKPFFTFMVAFAVMASGIASASTLSRGVAETYLPRLFDANPSDTQIVLIALGFLLIVAAVNFRGISESVKLNVVLTLVEVAGLLLIITIGVAALIDGVGDVGNAFSTADAKAAGNDVSLVPAALAGTALAFYALIGFEDSVNVAEEAKDPGRDFPRALFGGLAFAGVMYLVIGIIAPAVLPYTTLVDDKTTPLLEISQLGPLSVEIKIFAAIGVLALINGALINMIMASRLTYGMARQRIVPSIFGRVHRGRQTPWTAILFTTALAIILTATGDVSELATTTTTLLLGVFAVVNVSVLVLRGSPVEHRHFVAPTFLPAIGAVVCLTLLVYRIADGTDSLARPFLLLGLGVVFWLVNWVATRREPSEFDTGLIEKIEHPDDLEDPPPMR